MTSLPTTSDERRMMNTIGIDYNESGSGPTIVLVPGSCSTGSAWRSVIAAWEGRFRCVTTSLLGYGATAERRSTDDPSIAYEAQMLEAVISRAGGPVHLIGHSFEQPKRLLSHLVGQHYERIVHHSILRTLSSRNATKLASRRSLATLSATFRRRTVASGIEKNEPCRTEPLRAFDPFWKPERVS